MTNTPPQPGRHHTLRGEQRAQARQQAKAHYQDGKSIDAVAAELGLAYGRTRALLIEAGVTLRPHRGARLSSQRRAAIRDTAVARYTTGQSTVQIAADLGITSALICILLDEAGIARRPVQTAGGLVDRQVFRTQILAQHANGVTRKQIAADTGCDIATVRRLLAGAGPTPKRGPAPATADPVAEADAFTADLVARYTAGASLTQIAAQVGRSVSFVRPLLLRAGVTMRAPGRQKTCRGPRTDEPRHPNATTGST